MSETGTCTKNNICTAVNCINNLDPILSIIIDVTFLPCNDPISVHTRIMAIYDGINFIGLDEISTRNQDIPYPFSDPIPGLFVNMTFILTNTGVNYGVS